MAADTTRTAPTSHRVRTAHWDIHFTEAGSGLPLILIHGSAPGTSGWRNFHPNIGPLARHFRVLAIDLPGWGESSAATAEAVDHVGAVLEFMDALEIGRAALVGNSMGGIIATRIAALHPQRVSHLVAGGAAGADAPRVFSPAGPSEGVSRLLEAYRNPDAATMRAFYDAITFRSGSVSDEDVAERAAAAAAADEHRRNFLAAFGAPDYMPISSVGDISRITAPTLLIHGRDDRVVALENTLQLCTLIPSARAYVINQCGHCPQLEVPDEFNRIIHSFVSGT